MEQLHIVKETDTEELQDQINEYLARGYEITELFVDKAQDDYGENNVLTFITFMMKKPLKQKQEEKADTLSKDLFEGFINGEIDELLLLLNFYSDKYGAVDEQEFLQYRDNLLKKDIGEEQSETNEQI